MNSFRNLSPQAILAALSIAACTPDNDQFVQLDQGGGSGGSSPVVDQQSTPDCPPGSYGTGCTPCPAGQSCAGGAVDPAPCPQGTTCEAGSAQPTTCPAGYVCARGDAPPTACSPGEYCGPGSAQPVSCDAGTWDHDGDPATACVDHSECPAGERVAQGGTATSDRTCSACESGSFSTAPNAARCEPWQECPAGTYVENSPASDEDRHCTDCAQGSYSSTPNSGACAPAEACAAGTYQTSAATESAPAVCSSCPPGHYCAGEEAPPSPCVGDSWDGGNTAQACQPRTTCSSDEWELDPGDAQTDRQCQLLTTCGVGEYETLAPSSTSDRACAERTPCEVGQVLVQNPAFDEDYQCASCSPGEHCPGGTAPATSCPQVAGYDHDSDPTTPCQALTPECDLSTSYESQAPSATMNRACSPITVCSPGSEQTAAATATSDAECRTCSPGEYCAGGVEPAADCASASAYDSDLDPATPCVAWTACSDGDFAHVPGTSVSDQECTYCYGRPVQREIYSSSVDRRYDYEYDADGKPVYSGTDLDNDGVYEQQSRILRNESGQIVQRWSDSGGDNAWDSVHSYAYEPNGGSTYERDDGLDGSVDYRSAQERDADGRLVSSLTDADGDGPTPPITRYYEYDADGTRIKEEHDLDGDGVPDVVVYESSYDCDAGVAFVIWDNNADGILNRRQDMILNAACDWIQLEDDTNGDGAVDQLSLREFDEEGRQIRNTRDNGPNGTLNSEWVGTYHANGQIATATSWSDDNGDGTHERDWRSEWNDAGVQTLEEEYERGRLKSRRIRDQDGVITYNYSLGGGWSDWYETITTYHPTGGVDTNTRNYYTLAFELTRKEVQIRNEQGRWVEDRTENGSGKITAHKLYNEAGYLSYEYSYYWYSSDACYSERTHTYTYNGDNQMLTDLEHSVYTCSGSDSWSKWTYAYDEAGHRVLQLYDWNNDGVTDTRYVDEYDADGNLLSSKTGTGDAGPWTNISEYEYDETGERTRSTHDNQADGIIDSVNLYRDGRTVQYDRFSGGVLQARDVWDYDDSGNRILEERWSGAEPTLDRRYTWVYDEAGNVVEQRNDYDGDGSIDYSMEADYLSTGMRIYQSIDQNGDGVADSYDRYTWQACYATEFDGNLSF